MNRRTFLKIATAGAILLTQLPTSLKEHKESGFCPCCEYGQSVQLLQSWEKCDKCDKEFIIKFLGDQARKVLPLGTYYDIRMKIPDHNLGNYIAWYHAPYMKQRLGTLRKPEIDISGGHIFIIGGYLA